ncbi:MAG: hypothetical protein AAGC53_00035 [Actinomycetota bacterium]
MGIAFLLLVVFVGILLTGLLRPSETTIALFSEMYEVPVTAESRPIVERYIRGSRSVRMVGVFIGASAMVAVTATTDGSTNATFYLSVGYGLGAVAYELFRRAPGSGGANLARRHLDDYLHPLINRLTYITTAVGVTVYVLHFIVDHEPDPLATIQIVEYRTIGTVALAGLLAAAVAARRIIQAPQPVISPAVDAAQHAIRSAGLMSLIGLSLMAAGIVNVGAVEVGRSDAPALLGDIVSWVGMTLAVVALILGFFLTVRSLPRFAPFWRKRPVIEPAASAS